MASKYIQKFPIPNNFPEILSDFTREILRNQPEDIIEFSAMYFKCLQDGTVLDYPRKGGNIPNDFKVSVPKMPEKKQNNIAKDLDIKEQPAAVEKKHTQEAPAPMTHEKKRDVEAEIINNEQKPVSGKQRLAEKISDEDKSKLGNLSHNFVDNLWQSKSIEFEKDEASNKLEKELHNQ